MLLKKDVQLGSSLAGKRSESVAAESLSCGAFVFVRTIRNGEVLNVVDHILQN